MSRAVSRSVAILPSLMNLVTTVAAELEDHFESGTPTPEELDAVRIAVGRCEAVSTRLAQLVKNAEART
jgi:hypothetical protein